MPQPEFDRSRIRLRSLAERRSLLSIEAVAVDADAEPPPPGAAAEAIAAAAESIVRARGRGAPVVLCHGAHLIRNGLGPVVVRLMESGWVTHVATNGAGSIHDWEFAFAGRSTEDVRENVGVGEFGAWEETGRWPAVALHLGALTGEGYGRAVGRLIEEEQLVIPAESELLESARGALEAGAHDEAAVRLDALGGLRAAGLSSGTLSLPHPWKALSVQAGAVRLGVPITIHPGIGQDIVVMHPLFRGSVFGRAAVTDFLRFAHTIESLEGGVFLSVGSSVMSPMIFEKALSMARNVRRQQGATIEDFDLWVNDLMELRWDWSRGEPPRSDPAYYLRFCKSFSRMGGRFTYVGADNRVFLQNLHAALRGPGSR